MTDIITRYTEARKKAERLQKEHDRAGGALEQLLKRLREEFNCKTVQEGEKLKGKFEREEKELTGKLEKELSTFEERYSEAMEIE